MHPKTFMYITATALLGGLTIPVQLVQAQQKIQQPPRYYVFNLGAPLGGAPEPVGINNHGWISGGAVLASGTTEHAEAWIGVPLDLGTLGGPNSEVVWPKLPTRIRWGKLGVAQLFSLVPTAIYVAGSRGRMA
jgi:hypothetical protein